ncbi:MAG: argininosuccinate lyase [Bacteroidales bacterium]|nr:argininosuccinate lyase [Bacteroidales bacterium]
MHLWDKGGSTREAVISFTCGNDRGYDARLAPYDIVGSMAHAIMLEQCGLITAGEKNQLLAGLARLMEESLQSGFSIGKEYEDIHSWVEIRLHDLAGEAAGKLHTGRSRNDQVLTDLHLYIRHQSYLLARELKALADSFLDLSEKHKEVLMPGFTHLQAAMVTSFGLWFASFAESLCDDLHVLSGAAALADASPLGTAAGYGTSLPIDRELTASLLGFDRLVITSPYAQMSRGRTERQMTGAIASAANTIGRFASDVILFMSPGYGFVSLSDDLTTGSSIMPQKKNPDLFELIRARCNRLQAVPGEVGMMTAGLPSGYNRDYQELKAIIFDAFDGIMELMPVMQIALDGLVVRRDILTDKRYNDIFSVEEANDMVRSGVPFRDAYRIVAGKAGSGSYRFPDPVDYSHTGSIGNIGQKLIQKRLDEIMKDFVHGYSPQELLTRIKGVG